MRNSLTTYERDATQLASHFSNEHLMQMRAPALFTTHPHPKMSQRYGFTDTYNLVRHLITRGYKVRTVQQTGAGAYGKVLVRLTHPTLARSDHGAAEIVIIDSHDGTSKLIMMLGFLRFACANGLILGDMMFERRYKHAQLDLVEQVILDLDDATGSSNNAFGIISRMQNHIALPDHSLQLARDVAITRFDLDPVAESARVTRAAHALLSARRRSADLGSDLFTTMNVIQENALRGEIAYGYNGGTYKVRPVKAINKEVAINRAAWNGAVKLLEAA